MGRREERCCAVYEEAVKALPTEAMWKCYITFCLERFSKKTSSVPLRGQRLERTMLAFRKAHELKLLSEVQYKQWIDLLLRQDLFKEALQVAEAGTELFKDSVTMWQTKLQVLIDSKSPDVEMRFEEAFAHLKPQVCLPLWISWAEWSESAKSQEDFINYVQYEINLLELIQRRRARIKYSFKKDEIEYSMVHRVQGVFGRASAKWKDDVQLWLSYIVFCKKWGTKTHLSKIFSAMLAIHSNKPALWIMAAKWEMEDRLSSESARQLFLRALRFHPECPKLYQEYFRMELMHAEKLRKEKQEFEKAAMDMGDFDHPEEILKGELARIIYKNSISKIKGAEFHVSLLAIAQLFDFAKDLQKEIYDDLQALHTDDPLTWDYVARRELEIESQVQFPATTWWLTTICNGIRYPLLVCLKTV